MLAHQKNPTEIAAGVYWLPIGSISGNVYFVRSGSSWVLIDTALANRDKQIQEAAKALFGPSAPAAILLTHLHPDHSGSALALARAWGCPIYVHPDEMPLALAKDLSVVERFANPIDRWLVLPLLRALPRRWVKELLSKGSLEGVARTLAPDAAAPGLPDWRSITTPGHSPGHVVFFRESDRVLICGDAILTVELSSLRGLLSWALGRRGPRASAPPWYTNRDNPQAKASAAALLRLQPRVLATGHGAPIIGDASDKVAGSYAARDGVAQ